MRKHGTRGIKNLSYTYLWGCLSKCLDLNAMRPFAYYCWIVGGIILLTRIL